MTKDISRYNMRWIEGDTLPEAPKPKLSPKERYLKQLQENHRQSEETWAYVQANEERYATQRAQTLFSRNSANQAYQLTEKEWNDDLKMLAKEYQWDVSQQENGSIAVLTVAEANEYLELFQKDTHGRLSTGKDYTGLGSGLRGAYEVAKELGGFGATAKAVNINGITHVVVENYKPRYLDLGIRWQEATPKMLKIGYALNTVQGNVNFLRGNIYVEIVFSGAVNAVDYMLHNEKTLGEVVGQFTADVAKGVVAGIVAQGITLVLRGAIVAAFAAPPTAVVLGFFAISAFGIGLIVSAIDDQYQYTESMKNEIERLVDEN